MTRPFVPPPSSPAADGARSRARADLVWYLRHADALARWPVIAEEWAQALERRRTAPPPDDRPRSASPS